MNIESIEFIVFLNGDF